MFHQGYQYTRMLPIQMYSSRFLGDIYLYEDKMGMTVTSGSVTIKKDSNNLIGISIGGGSPLCPCLYIVQIFDNTAACRDGTLQSGDELVSVNGQSVKGKTKVEVAKMIQAAKDEVIINYNKLHADPQQGKSLDIVLKKMKHRLVENMSSSTADALGLSRAILCNDTLVKKMQELQDTELMYRGLVDHCKRVLQAHMELLQAVKAMGDVFAGLAVREPQPRASEAFRLFGEQHRTMEKYGIDMVKKVKPVLSDMGTYLYKAIPDTRLTVKKYADAKFEYLAYCLKVKEMDDEECSYASLQEPLYRVETGNYEYRNGKIFKSVAMLKIAIFCDHESDEQEVEEGEDLIEHGNNHLICNLETFKDTNIESEDVLIPDLQTNNQLEPDYNEMDNLTLLSSLCLQESPQNRPLLPDLD
nr:PRKCA-binding protein [Leptinotarsa decemlineata]